MIILLICVGTSLMTIGYQMVNHKYKTETAIVMKADDSVTFKGVYIRDEEVVKYGGEGTVSYCVSDGGKIGSGSAIAEIYADEGQIDIKQRINDLNDELSLLKKIQNPGTLRSAQPANIAVLINEKYKKIVNSREKCSLEDISEEKNEFLVMLSTYQLLTDMKTDFKERINEINAGIVKLRASETVPLNTVRTDHSGYFVSYADGYEDKLRVQNLKDITPELINEIQDSGPVEDKKIIGKVINGYEWYIAGVIDNRKINFVPEQDVKIKFQSSSDIVDGVVCEVKATENPEESVVIVKCDEINYDLVQHRTERIEMIAGISEGIKVPRKAIRFLDMQEKVTDEETGEESVQTVNCKGVYVKLGERVSFKKIDVIYEGGDYVLSSLYGGSGYLSLYDDIVVEGVDADGN